MIIIPDVHGWTFWKDAVKDSATEEIIFLGDYVDPYPYMENVNVWDGLIALSEIIEFKKKHPKRVTLLLGNHDLSYVSQHIFKCRHDYENHNDIKTLIKENKFLFKIAHEKSLNGRRYVFSHAGILPNWMSKNKTIIGDVQQGKEVEALNQLYFSGELNIALGDVSPYRGGLDEAGSIVWADVSEHVDYWKCNSGIVVPKMYQVFGHTLQLSGEPVITPHFACLDCRKAFCLSMDGKIETL